MNDIVSLSNPAGQTMSSREIADLTEKRHDNVMRDTRAMLIELHGERDALKFEGVYRGANGEDRPCFNLPKRETLILISGYSVTLRAKIIDRWEQLEAERRNPVARRYESVAALLESLPRLPDSKRPNPANLAGITMFIEGHPQLAGRMAWDGLRGQPMVDGGPIEHEHVSEFRYVMHSEDFMAGKRKTRDGMILAAKRTLDRSIPLLSH